MQKIIGGRLTESIQSEQWVEIHLKRHQNRKLCDHCSHCIPRTLKRLKVDLLCVEVFDYLFLNCIPKSTRFKPLLITLES